MFIKLKKIYMRLRSKEDVEQVGRVIFSGK